MTNQEKQIHIKMLEKIKLIDSKEKLEEWAIKTAEKLQVVEKQYREQGIKMKGSLQEFVTNEFVGKEETDETDYTKYLPEEIQGLLCMLVIIKTVHNLSDIEEMLMNAEDNKEKMN